MKNKKYWLNWGIRTSIIFLFLSIVITVHAYFSCGQESFCYTFASLIPLMILGFGVPILTLNGIGLMFFSSTIYGGEHSMSIAGIYVILIITIAIVYFLIGAFLGWVYGKIKNRKVKNI